MQCLESAYTAHGLLRNAHVQSVLSSSAWRKQAGLNRLTALGVTAQPRILSLPDGTRLSGLIAFESLETLILRLENGDTTRLAQAEIAPCCAAQRA